MMIASLHNKKNNVLFRFSWSILHLVLSGFVKGMQLCSTPFKGKGHIFFLISFPYFVDVDFGIVVDGIRIAADSVKIILKKYDILQFTRQPGGQSDMVWCFSGLKIW